jgi:hypothetical protein
MLAVLLGFSGLMRPGMNPVTTVAAETINIGMVLYRVILAASRLTHDRKCGYSTSSQMERVGFGIPFELVV